MAAATVLEQQQSFAADTALTSTILLCPCCAPGTTRLLQGRMARPQLLPRPGRLQPSPQQQRLQESSSQTSTSTCHGSTTAC